MATGAMTSEVEGLIREAIELHLAGMRQDGETIPLLSSQVWIGRYSLNSDM